MSKCFACGYELTKMAQCRCPAVHWCCPMCGRRYVKWFDDPMKMEKSDEIIDRLSMSSADRIESD